MIITYSGVFLILLFLLITFLMSSYEKMIDWKKTFLNYSTMYKGIVIPSIVKISLVLIIGLEIITSTIIGIALYDIVVYQNLLFTQYAFILSSFLLLILLIGLRMLKDYSGASGIGIYFLISVIGLFWSQYL